MTNLYLRGAQTSNLPSIDPLSMSVYFYLKYVGIDFDVKYTSGVPYLETVRGSYFVEPDSPFKELKKYSDLDQKGSLHPEFASRIMHQLKNLELVTIHYLFQKFPTVEWPENLKNRVHLMDKTEKQIQEMVTELSTSLSDNCHLFRVTVKIGDGFDVNESRTYVMKKGRHYGYDYNPISSLDSIFTGISMLIRGALVDTPLYDELIKHTNLSAYVERFIVKYEKATDAVDLGLMQGAAISPSKYMAGPPRGSDLIGKGVSGSVYHCTFPPNNPFNLQEGTYAVKVYSLSSFSAHMVVSQHSVSTSAPFRVLAI